MLVVEALSIEDKEADATLDDAALAAKLQAEEYGTHDVVLRDSQGIKLDANTLHALRMLHPARRASSSWASSRTSRPRARLIN